MDKISFVMTDGEAVDFFVLEQTVLQGITYLLVTDQEDGDGEAWILKDLSEDGDEEAVYEMVDDDEELDAVAAVFETMLEGIDLES